MDALMVECLRCGNRRSAERHTRHVEAGECPRCGYVGWAASVELTESARRALRDRPVERRRIHAVVA
jgi:Zn ribbon nucleic-acid-binding protein